MFPLSPSFYRWVAYGVIAALLFMYGYMVGVKSMSAPLAACKATVAQVQAHSEALKSINAQTKKESDHAIHQTVIGWKAAVDYLRTHPVGLRVRTACGTGTGTGLSAPAGSLAQDAGKPGSGTSGSQAIEVPIEEIIDRLNKAQQDAAQILYMLDHDSAQAEIGRGK